MEILFKNVRVPLANILLGEGRGFEIAMIQVVAPNMACEVIDWAMQAYGGAGMCDDFPLAYAYTCARTLRFADRPNEVHRHAIAKNELRKYSTP